MKKEKSKHKSIRKQFWSQRYLFLLLFTGAGMGSTDLLCADDRIVHGVYQLYASGKRLLCRYGKFTVCRIGLVRILFSTDFLMIMRNTLATSLLTLVFSFPLPIILALCLNEVKNQRVKKFVQTSSYIPYFISWVIAANIFLTFLSADGVINHLLQFLGLTDQEILFFQNGPYFWWIIAIANAWKVLGYNAIIYMAAISGISQDMYEAADVDGATRMQKILHITLPALRPTILILLILAIGGVLNTGYEQQLLMSNDSILNYSDVLDTYAYRYGLKNGMYSYGTAVGLFKSVVSFLLVISANALSRKFSDDNTALF